MQYGTSQFLLFLIIYSVIHLSQCKKNAVDAAAEASQKNIGELNKDCIIITNYSNHHKCKEQNSNINSSKRSIRHIKDYRPRDNIRKIERYRTNKSYMKLKNYEDNKKEKPVKHKSAFFTSCEDEDVLPWLIEEESEEPLTYDNRLPLYEEASQDISVILDDIDMLIDKFEKVSKELDLRHRKVNRSPCGCPFSAPDRSNKDILMWENSNRLAWKTRQHLSTDWSEWSEWSPCSVTCGQGIRIRSRYKLTKNIPAEIEELQEKKCTMPDCPPFNLAKFISKVFFDR